jgi:hypothetical protein
MIKDVLLCCFFLTIYIGQVFALDNSKQVILNERVVYISEVESSIITMRKGVSIYEKCKITNLQKKDTENGNGIINLTSDKKAIIFYSSGRYLLADEIIKCRNGNVTIRDSPDPKSAVHMLQDVNFENEIYLSLSLEDKGLWSAIIAKFNSDKNLLSGNGFFNNSEAIGYGFEIFGLGSGSISVDGKYAAPNGWGCSKDDVPGVWDIQQKEKVVFLSEDDKSNEINNKCLRLFNGDATLKELDGELLRIKDSE